MSINNSSLIIRPPLYELQLPAGPLGVDVSIQYSRCIVTAINNNTTTYTNLLQPNDTILSINGAYDLITDIIALPDETERRRSFVELDQRLINDTKKLVVFRPDHGIINVITTSTTNTQHVTSASSHAHPPPPRGILAAVSTEGDILEQNSSGGLDNERQFDFSDVPEFDTLEETLEWVSKYICKTANLRPLQKKALKHLLEPSICDGKLLLVNRTGSGKSHVMRMLGVMMGGVIVIIVPLLSLSADQMEKMTSISQQTGPMGTVHCDEFSSDPGALEPLIKRIQQMKDNTTTTIFLLTSPQFLAKKSTEPLRAALFEAHEKGLLRGVVIDELHLYLQHSTFRHSIPMLRDIFFKKVFPPNKPEIHPPILLMTATMTPKFIRRAEELTTIKLPKQGIIWPDASHFEQRNVNIEYSTTSNFTSPLDDLIGIITNTIKGKEHGEHECVVVITTSANKAIDIHKKFNNKLNKKLDESDIVLIHGGQHKLDKFYKMWIFGNKRKFTYFKPRGLVTNGAGNTGIDHPHIVAILRAGLPMDLLTAFQEKGRIRVAGIIRYLCNVQSILQVYHLIYDPSPTSFDDGVPEEIRGINSAIVHAKDRATATNTLRPLDDDDIDADDKRKYALSARKLSEWKQDRLGMFLDVLKFFFLDQGCLHIRAECYMSSGILGPAPSTMTPCGNMCAICDKSWHKQHKKIRKKHVIEWFRSSDFTDKMPLSTVNAPDALTNLLWKKEYWMKHIFGLEVKSIRKFNIECLMESLIAAEIITHKYKKLQNGKNDIQWLLNRVMVNSEEDETMQIERPCYEIDLYWRGIPQRYT